MLTQGCILRDYYAKQIRQHTKGSCQRPQLQSLTFFTQARITKPQVSLTQGVMAKLQGFFQAQLMTRLTGKIRRDSGLFWYALGSDEHIAGPRCNRMGV